MPLTEWELLSREVMQDRRKGKRVCLTFPIEVSGFDRSGRLFSERTVTQDISEAGVLALYAFLRSKPTCDSVNRGDYCH